MVPKGGRGTGFGWYHLTQGVLLLVASVGFGWLWDAHGSRVAFLVAAGFAILAVGALGLLAPGRAEAPAGRLP